MTVKSRTLKFTYIIIHPITGVHVRDAPGMTDIHPHVRTPRTTTTDDARGGVEHNASHSRRPGVRPWREEGVTLAEEGWLRMNGGGVPAASIMHGMLRC
jgi:hypothetical protein